VILLIALSSFTFTVGEREQVVVTELERIVRIIVDDANAPTMLALKDLEAATGKRPEFFHMPAYEYTILVAMRFHPLYRGTRIRLRLTADELANKMQMMQAYPSQIRLFTDFSKVFGIIGKMGYLTGGPKNAEQFVTIEEFGPVPEGLDYTAKPHLFDYFTYMFDDFEGVPVRFLTSVRPIVAAFLANPG
jgi:hypothetical protein